MKEADESYVATLKQIKSIHPLWAQESSKLQRLSYSGFGSSTLQIPDFHKNNIIQSSSNSAELFQYNDNNGLPTLIQSILNYFPEIHSFTKAGINITQDNILISPGAVKGIHLAFGNLASPADQILLFEPLYPYYLNSQIFKQQLTLKSIPFHFNQKQQTFQINFQLLQSQITSKTRFIILCNPNNPIGKIFTVEEYKRIGQILSKFPNLIILEDRAYFTYYNTHNNAPSIFACINPQHFERILTFYSCGKLFDVTGTRVGFIVGSKQKISNLTIQLLQDFQFSSVFEQDVMAKNLKDSAEMYEGHANFYESVASNTTKRANYLITELKNRFGFECLPYEGSYYITLNVESLRGKIEKKYFLNSNTKQYSPFLDVAVGRKLIEKAKIGVIPFSVLMINPLPEVDIFVRVSTNRNEKDIEYFLTNLACLFINEVEEKSK